MCIISTEAILSSFQLALMLFIILQSSMRVVLFHMTHFFAIFVSQNFSTTSATVTHSFNEMHFKQSTMSRLQLTEHCDDIEASTNA